MTERNKIGIIGSGLIGRSWAIIFASAGYEVFIYDILDKQLKIAMSMIDEELRKMESMKLLRGHLSVSEQKDLICSCTNLKRVVEDAFLVQECVPENLDLKHKVYAEIEPLVDDHTIIASSTSTFLPSVLSSNMKRKNQFLVSHPINPPHYVPMVEVVPAPWTRPELPEKMVAMLQKVGQVPIKFKKEIEGFALNRMQYAIINECFNLVQDDILDPTSVDKVVSQALGLRYAFMGPLETAHLNAEGFRNYCERYTDAMYKVSMTFKPPPRIAGPTVDKISDALEKDVPLSRLAERRKWRDTSLMKLAILKKDN